jgi:hypothetical protein
MKPHLLFEIAVELPPSKQEQQPAKEFREALHISYLLRPNYRSVIMPCPCGAGWHPAAGWYPACAGFHHLRTRRIVLRLAE